METKLYFLIKKIKNKYCCKLDKVKTLYVLDGDQAGYAIKANTKEELYEKILSFLQEEMHELQDAQMSITTQLGEIDHAIRVFCDESDTDNQKTDN